MCSSAIRIGIVLGAIAAAMLPVYAAVYYAVLTDGTWIPAAAEPTVVEGKARIPLRGGLIAVLDAELIDWPASKKYSAAGEQPKGPHAVPGKGLAAGAVFTNAAPAGGVATQGTAAAPSTAPPAASPAGSSASEAASLHARIATLDEQIATLDAQANDLRSRMGDQWNLDEKEKLEQQLDGVEREITQLRERKESLLTDLWNLQQP